MLGLHNGDIMKSINGDPIPDLGPQIMGFFEKVLSTMKEGKEFTMGVLRPTEDGQEEAVTLTTTTIKIKRMVPYAIRAMKKPTAHQLLVRNAWLGLN